MDDVELPKMDGLEVRPGVRLIGEPTPMPGTNLMRCLANVDGQLCLIEIRVRRANEVPPLPPRPVRTLILD